MGNHSKKTGVAFNGGTNLNERARGARCETKLTCVLLGRLLLADGKCPLAFPFKFTTGLWEIFTSFKDHGPSNGPKIVQPLRIVAFLFLGSVGKDGQCQTDNNQGSRREFKWQRPPMIESRPNQFYLQLSLRDGK